jgi:hypothetical protein
MDHRQPRNFADPPGERRFAGAGRAEDEDPVPEDRSRRFYQA